eukprot:gene14064-17191_t
MIHRRALFATPALLPSLALAQPQADWPQRPVNMMIPFVAGGPSDITGRVIAARLGGLLGQPVVVENRPGANGAVAAQVLAR